MSTEAEIKSWLKIVLKDEDFLDFSVALEGNTERGEGYMGDVVFVNVSGKILDGSTKTLRLCLKCSKKSQTLRETIPVKESFENEIYFYNDIIPAFTQFQEEKGVTEVFSSLPKFHGSYVTENMEVVVLENLQESGHYLLDKRKAVPSDHLRLLLEEYGTFHAISAAFQDQRPCEFEKLVEGMKRVWKLFTQQTNAEGFFGPPIQEIYEILKSCISEEAAEKLQNFKSQVSSIIGDITDNRSNFSVVAHTDCWSNNFMFKSEGTSLKVVMLDWQAATFCSPIADISYMIHACASEQDLENFENLLSIYYRSFSDHVRLLGSDPEKIFPFSQFIEDFKVLGKYGIMLTTLVVKVALSDKEEIIDFAETAEGAFENTFTYKNKDPSVLRDRMLYIIEHIIKHDLL